MRVQREPDRFVIALNLLESRVLVRVFQALDHEYKLTPGAIDPKVAASWYSTRGCVTAKLTDEETREWVNHLQAFKAARLGRLEEWAKQLTGTQHEEFSLQVAAEDVDSFLTTLNDYRLMTAARHEIGQAEMDLHEVDEWISLPPARRSALFEIHFLAVMLEEILRELQ